MYGKIRRLLGNIFHELARQKECTIIEGHVMPDHVHMLVTLPKGMSDEAAFKFLKGASAYSFFKNHPKKV